MAATDDLTSQPSPTLNRWSDNLMFWRRSAPEGIKHAAGLVDIFAAFVSIDNRVDRAEAEVALDLLRHAFPEANHAWLSRRLHRALTNPKRPERIASKLKNELSPDDHVALGLQLYLLVTASGSSYLGQEAFTKVMNSLGAEETGQIILEEMKGLYYDGPLPFDKVIFSCLDYADVLLPATGDRSAFRAYQSNDIIIIRNTGKEPIWVSGSSLATGQCLRLRQHQNIRLPEWTLTTEDIGQFLNAARTGHRQTIFLNEQNGQLSANQSRSRSSSVRLDFGLNVHVEALRETSMRLPDQSPLKPGITHILSIQDHLLLEDGTEINLDSLRKQSLETGGRFQMVAGRRECLVSNDPSMLKKEGDILLSAGLAQRTVLKIKFNPQSAEGHVEVIEADHAITINGRPVRSGDKLVDGSLIRLSANQAVRCRFSEGLLDEERTVIRELNVEGLNHRFGLDKTVLDNVEFSVKRGEMLCIMGPSGSGKSTLLSALAGHLHPTRGHVRLNGVSLYKHRARLAPFIASMPQEEALNPQLTVREHLAHAATIRRPHLGHSEHTKRVDAILAELDLQQLAQRKVGAPGEKTISGGERGRLNLGLDLSSAAEIFLFDEPISGLSSKDSEHVAETLHALSRDKIVIASLHRPGARVLRLFDKVLMLDQGGKVAFFGPPKTMISYFQDACEEFQIHLPKQIDTQQEGADFVFDVLETPLHGLTGREGGGARRFPSSFWQDRFEGSQLVEDVARGEIPSQSHLGELPVSDDQMAVPSRSSKQRWIEWFRLFRTHLLRSLLSKFRNRGTIYSILLEAPLLALLIGITLRSSPEGQYDFHTSLHLPVYLFLSATIAMFLGLTNSATEILRDSPVMRRERNCRSGVALYVGAKFLALSILAAIQCGIYIWIGDRMLEIHNMFFIHWGWMTLTAICGTAMALVVSSLVTSERAALSAVPLLLVPQLLLAGALVSFEEMNRGLFQGGDKGRSAGVEPFPARFMPLRYAYEGIMVSQATENTFEEYRRKIQADIDPLKERNDLRLAGDMEQGLSAKESARLETLKSALTRLMASAAIDADVAEDLCWQITHAGRKKDLKAVEAIPPYPSDESIPVKPSSHYFVNSRTDLLVGKAELERVDIHQKTKRSLFLAEWKYWLGMTTKTTHACQWVLGASIAICLMTTILILQRRNRKNN
ncbi:ATP-binding cassette domain-containing protein [Verrucomicrobiaceae bacterium N1E253]|uniref:ATP-binding cassette domain-containing protein n=1 Tax=Oceaniferula marina TaxID=2748318 RepID=A0A851GI40_9BACT|nr:ATP-binding cassette domain-containing protein [Oceaniferula marina]NWK57016.1 ATP-binding cassette domain-containing protein [Oceaniferula marina]